MNYKDKLIERYVYIYKMQNVILKLIKDGVDIYPSLENILLGRKHLGENEYYYYLEHLRENINLKDNLNHSNMIIILDSLYKYIDSQKKDKKNATIKLQVINEYLSIALYKNIDNTQKIKNNFVRNKEDIGVYNNSFINTFSYGPSYFYYESEHLTDKEKQKIKELL